MSSPGPLLMRASGERLRCGLQDAEMSGNDARMPMFATAPASNRRSPITDEGVAVDCIEQHHGHRQRDEEPEGVTAPPTRHLFNRQATVELTHLTYPKIASRVSRLASSEAHERTGLRPRNSGAQVVLGVDSTQLLIGNRTAWLAPNDFFLLNERARAQMTD